MVEKPDRRVVKIFFLKMFFIAFLAATVPVAIGPDQHRNGPSIFGPSSV